MPAVTPWFATPVEAPVQVVPAAPVIDASSGDAVAPASKKACRPQQPLQPMPHLQPPLPTSSGSPAALPEPTATSSPTEPETKKQKQQHGEDDEDLAMDSLHPLQPIDPPVLPLSEQQPAAAADLEASRSRSRTHSEVSEAPTIQYPDPAPYPPRQSGQEEAPLLYLHLIHRHEVLQWHQLSSTPILPRHVDECTLNWVTIRTSCSGRIWVSTILCSGWTTLRRRQPTTRST